MELILILQIILGVSVFGILFIIFRNFPLILTHEPKYIPKEKRMFFKLKKGVSEKRMRTSHRTHKWREKIFHRLRILILKLDNILLSYTHKVRERRMHLEKIHFAKKEKRKQKKEAKKSSRSKGN
jgi:hypothetical protein